MRTVRFFELKSGIFSKKPTFASKVVIFCDLAMQTSQISGFFTFCWRFRARRCFLGPITRIQTQKQPVPTSDANGQIFRTEIRDFQQKPDICLESSDFLWFSHAFAPNFGISHLLLTFSCAEMFFGTHNLSTLTTVSTVDFWNLGSGIKCKRSANLLWSPDNVRT